MDESVLFNGVMQAVLGGRKRRGNRAMGYLGAAGSALLSNPTALLTAAGRRLGHLRDAAGRAGGAGLGSGAGLNTSGAGLNPRVPASIARPARPPAWPCRRFRPSGHPWPRR